MRRLRAPAAPLLALSLLVALVAAPRAARADDDVGDRLDARAAGGLLDGSSHRRRNQLSVFVGLPWYWGFVGAVPAGLGGRFYVPLLHDGFLPEVNDSLGFEVGADLSFHSMGAGRALGASLAFPLEALWKLHVLPRFGVYGKLGFAIDVGFPGTCAPNGTCVAAGYVWPFFVASAGLSVDLTRAVSVRLEGGYPWVRLGLGVAL